MSKKKILHRSVDVKELKRIRKEEMDPKVRDRIMAVIMETQGYDRREIADLLGTTRSTVWRWIKWFDKSGVNGLRDEQRSGRPPKLSKRGKERLRKDLGKSPRDFGYEVEVWSTKLVLDHLRRRYGVYYHPRYIQRFLRKLGFELKKPRPKHYKASEEERERYYREIEEIKKGHQ
ncbi:hypothetical protein AKJ45_02380 [candidate division MSBL1 archaeon SCGC-AAA261F19]|uniref:Uncharacterized protein n=1 Tax=candidate division MSBL1 archaeon SCGC-AAA261F19 TaxID=1698275 RepID=A0A133V9T2_9EURY|nr:hypothetical protein AKJ45_02380 [candidate division MSBL1 archaeon SCGC-AAA261F19]